jgi:hypothetical protein
MAAMKISGKYHYCSNTDTYHYVKKTGFLVKSPSAGKIGRWRRRWFKLMDMVAPHAITNIPTRHIRLEYYKEEPRHQGGKCSGRNHPMMKGIMPDLV